MLVLGCTSNFFLIHKKIDNWDFWMFSYFQILPIH